MTTATATGISATKPVGLSESQAAASAWLSSGSRSAFLARPGSWQNPFLLAAVAVAFLLQLGGVFAPPLQAILGTLRIAASEAAGVTAVALAGYLTARAVRYRPTTS